MAKKTVAAKKRNVKVDANGQLHVHSSFNNIIVSLANSEGQIISWSSAGKMGFRGSKKNTPYAAQMAAQDCAKIAFDLGLRKVKAYVKGPGNGRESAIRTIHGAGIEVTEIIDVTPLPDVRPRIWKFKPSLPGREEERVTTKPGVAPCRAAPTLVMARLSNTWLPICSTAPVNVAFFCVP